MRLFAIVGAALVILYVLWAWAENDLTPWDSEPNRVDALRDVLSDVDNDSDLDDLEDALVEEGVSEDDAQDMVQALENAVDDTDDLEELVDEIRASLRDADNDVDSIEDAIAEAVDEVNDSSSTGNSDDDDQAPSASGGDSGSTGGNTGSGSGSPSTSSGSSGSANGMWGPAGEAPQSIEEAAELFGVEPQFLTKLNPSPGDDTVIGWVIGTNGTEAMNIRIHADHIPAGTCVDFDPGASSITNSVEHAQDMTPMWRRALTSSDGEFDGLKASVYWTPCVFTDGYKSSGNKTSASSPPPSNDTAANACPASADEAAARYGGSASSWAQHRTFPNGWIYAGPVIPGFAVPPTGKVDYDGGSQESGTVPSGSAFTAWCPK